jgi:hypothetical protein
MESGTVVSWFVPLGQICSETHPLRLPPHLGLNAPTDSDHHNIHSRRTGKVHKGGTMFHCKSFCSYVIPALFVGIMAAALTSCGGHSKPISITVTATAGTVDGSDTTTLTATITNDKNAAGVTWSVSGGGTLSGTTTTSATYTAPAATSSSQTATITATSVAESTITGTATITVPAAPTVTTTSSSLTGSVGASLSLALQGSGGIPPYKWAVSNTGSALPACLTLNSSGTISFTSNAQEAACAAGSPYSNLIFTFTDAGTPNPLTATSSPLTITIQAATPITLPTPSASVPGPGTAGTTYSASLAATGGITPLAYAITGGALPNGLTLNASSGAITGTPTKSGTFAFSLTASDNYGDLATQSYSINVNPGPATTLQVAAPASESAGASFNFTVTAYDANGNIATGYTGTVKFTSSDSKAALPANSALSKGTGTFAATFKTVGTETLTATDTATSSITGTSNSVSVTAAPVSQLVVSAPSTATAGTAFNVTVTAEDTYGNTVSSYSGTVAFSTSDKGSKVVLPASYTFVAADSGSHTFTNGVKLVTAASQTVTATDSANLLTGVSGAIAVSPGSANRLAIVAPASANAGASISLTVTAYDAYSNVATGYTGTVAFTSTDQKASLPTNSTLTSGTGTFAATLKTEGKQTITGTDTVTSSITGSSQTIVVSPASLSQLLVTAPSSATAGTAFSITVTAADTYGNIISGYAGTVHFTSSDTASGVVLPGNYTFTAADAGVHTFASGVKLITAGSRTVTAADTSNAADTGSATVTVNPATVTKLVASAPATATAGTAFNVTVTAEDTYGNTVTTFSDKVNFTSTDPAAALPVSSSLTNGTANFAVTLKTAGNQTVTGTDASNGAITGTSGTIAVSPASATHFQVAAPASATAGTPINVAVTALDAYGNLVTAYAGTVKFTSTDTQASLPPNSTLTKGTGSFAVTLKTAGTQTVTAADTVSPTITGTSGNVAVSAAAVSKLAVSAPATATAGTSINVTVSAVDAYNNTVTTFSDKVNFTSSDSSAVLPGSSSLANGTGTFAVTLKTAGSRTVTGTDASNGTIAGTSGTITVSAAAATHFQVAAPGAATAGTAFNFTVSAYDAYGNTATGYMGTVKFGSTDMQAVLPANSTLTNGTGTFPATMKSAGSQTITATDTVTASITGTSGSINVSAAPLYQLSVSAPSSATAGVSFNVTVTAQDKYNNTVVNYADTVHFTSSDSQAVLPANSTLTNGIGTFAETLKTAGSQTVKATDTSNSSITGGASVTVNPATLTKLVVSAPATATAGTAFNITVTAEDTFNNTVTTFADKVNFISTDLAAALPASSSLTNGTATFAVTLKTAGNQTVTGTDASNGAITGTSGTIAVSPASATHFQVAAPASATAGTSFNVAVTALDSYGNTVTAYAGTVKFTSTDTQASLPSNSMLTNGTATFAVTLKTAGTQTVTAADTVNASINGISGNITVSPGATVKLSVVAPSTATTSVAFNFTVTAIDTYGNTTPAYTGTVQFSSNDTTAPLPTLPANSTLTNGTKAFSATFASNGTWTIKATDTTTSSITGTSGNITVSTVLTITTSGLNSLDVNQTPTQVLTAAGGSGNPANYTWSWTAQGSSSIPPGLTLNGASGAIQGTPSTAGSYSVTVKVVDSGITPNQTATANFTISIYGALTLSSSLPTGYVGVNYFGSVTGGGGSNQGDLSLTVVSGLPNNGLSTSANGPGAVNIGGAPASGSTPYTISFTMKLTDSATNASISQGFSITVDTSTYVLPTSNPPAATDGQTYDATIIANITGGSGQYAWIINGVQIASNTPTALGTVALSQQFYASDTGNNVLTLSTASETTVSGTGTFTFTVAIYDTVTKQTSTTQQYTFTVNAAGSQVSGQITLNNFCGNNNGLTLPQFTITINTSPVQTTYSDSSGNYSFASIPNGTYTITPSISGPESLFYPATQANVVVDNNPVSGENFQVSLGYTFSGTVTYGGTTTGPIYLQLNNDSCGPSNGTTIATPGPFTIRGVAPGNYNLNAWRDNLGYGQQNASNPTGSVSNISVSTANLTGQSITITDPAAVTLSTAPTLGPIDGSANGALINYAALANSNDVETATSYTVEWSTTTTFAAPSSSNSTSFAATGANNNNVLILNTANVTGLTAGDTYYFRAQGVNASSTSSWSSTVGPITLTAPSAANTVTGQITWTGTATGPLYVVFYDSSTEQAWMTQVGTKTSPPTSPASYTVEVPDGTYGFAAIIDQNNNGLIDAGDITNVNSSNGNGGPPNVTISGSTTENTTLPSAASNVSVTTQFSQNPNGSGGTSTNYSLDLEVRQGIKLPIAVTLASGPNLINPVDMGPQCSGCDSFQYNAGIGSNVPKVGDTYTFDVTYSDGTTGTVTGVVSGVLTSSALPTLISPTGTGIDDTPSFDWTYPANASNYVYQFWVCCGSNGTIWSIPGNNSNSNGFTSSQITPPLVWGVDPTNSSNLPSPSTLSAGTNYSWAIWAEDSNGNAAQAQLNFETKTGPVSLPPASNNPLPSGEVGIAYSGAINASGGAGGGNYYFIVNGTTIPTNMSYVTATNSDGLTFANSGGSTLWVGGTPASVESVSLTVEVVDSTNSSDTATVTYTVAINAQAPLTITVDKVPQGMVNMPYTFSNLNITGGVSPYTVTYSNLPAGLQQSGSDSWWIVGTPTSSGPTTVTVKVTDTSEDSVSTTFTLPVVPETVAAHNNYIKGQYACYAEQFWDGGILESSTGNTLYRGGSVFAFTADGNGNITGGEVDTNNPVKGYTSASQNGSVTGTYVIGSDGRGYLTVPGLWAIAGANFNSSGQFSEFDLVRMDDAGTSPSTHHGAGHCYQQNTATALNTLTPSGGYVYGMRGEDDKGNIETIAGSMQYTSSTTMSFVQDIVDAGVYTGDMTGSGTVTSALDAYGRMMVSAGPTGQPPNPSVIYITNNPAGEAVLMAANPHNASNNSDFYIGEMRAQNAAHVAASYPLSGPMVMYMSGLDTSLTDYKAQEVQLTGSTTSASFTAGGPILEDQGGTFKTESISGSISLSTNSTTGRTTMTGQTGDVFYVYDTGSALVLFGDVGNGGGSTAQDQFGWIEPQTVPSSGKWAASDLASTYFSLTVPNGDYNKSFNSTEITANSSGALTYFAQDEGGQNEADWDETLSGQSATAAVVPDTTLDPNGAYGIFDLKVTQSGTTETESYCIAISVDKATNSGTKGRLVCIDAKKGSPQISISQE